jgi:hypothetical protein
VAPNLLPNGDFERGDLTGWTGGAGASASTAQAHGGAWSACLEDATLRSARLDVQPGAAYKLTAWVKIVAGGDYRRRYSGAASV